MAAPTSYSNTPSTHGSVDSGGLRDSRVIHINRVAKVVKGGVGSHWPRSSSATTAIESVGLGYGKAKEVPLAIQKGTEEAKKNLFDVPLAGSTITHPVIGVTGAGRVLMKPAAAGTGVIAGARLGSSSKRPACTTCCASPSARPTPSTSAPRNDPRSAVTAAAGRSRQAPWTVGRRVRTEGHAQRLQRACQADRRRRFTLMVRPTHASTSGDSTEKTLTIKQVRSTIANKPKTAARCARSGCARSATPTRCPIARRSAA